MATLDRNTETKKTAAALERFSGYHPTLAGMRRSQKSAVCIPLIPSAEGYSLLFEVRSMRVGRQPGDICFPGGMMEAGETPAQTAVRESCEELLIRPEQLRLLGMSDVLAWSSGTGLVVYPMVAVLRDYAGSFSPQEVAETFTVPLEFLLDARPRLHYVSSYPQPGDDFPFDQIQGGRDYQWRARKEEMYFYTYEGRTIWGMTAKILEAFLQVVRELSM